MFLNLLFWKKYIQFLFQVKFLIQYKNLFYFDKPQLHNHHHRSYKLRNWNLDWFQFFLTFHLRIKNIQKNKKSDKIRTSIAKFITPPLRTFCIAIISIYDTILFTKFSQNEKNFNIETKTYEKHIPSQSFFCPGKHESSFDLEQFFIAEIAPVSLTRWTVVDDVHAEKKQFFVWSDPWFPNV